MEKDAPRSIESDGVQLVARVLPEVRDRAEIEAGYRARGYAKATPGEKRSSATYLVTVAVLHYLRLPAEERKAIYAEMRAVMDDRCKVADPEAEPLELPEYRPRAADPAPAAAPESAEPPVRSGHGVSNDPVRSKIPRRRAGNT